MKIQRIIRYTQVNSWVTRLLQEGTDAERRLTPRKNWPNFYEKQKQAHAAYESTLGHRDEDGQLGSNLYHQQITETEGNATMNRSLSYTHVLSY